MGKVVEISINRFSYADKIILENVNFTVEKGEAVVIAGLSGSGKTTLIRLLNGLIPQVYEGKLTGEIKILGKSTVEYKAGELAKYIGNVFQNPDDQFFSNEVENEIALVGENTGLERSILLERVNSAMEQLDIVSLKGRKLRELSGGQKQKVAIASTLVYDSDIIILDEPTANLDFTSIEDMRRVLKKLKEQGKTIIIAEHRLFYLKYIIDRLILLKAGHLENIFLPEDLNESIRKENMLRCFDYSELTSEAAEAGEEVLVRVNDLSVKNKSYKLNDLAEFSLKRGECMAVIGENGIGKTTLAKELMGLLPIKRGEVSYAISDRERLRYTAASLQNCRNMFFYETVEKELIPREKEADREYLDKVKKYLIHLELWDKRTMNPHDLSGGEKQRLALLISMLKKSKLVILDEPTAGLDYKRMSLVSSIIEEKAKEVPVILITHDLELLFKVCNTAYLMSEKGHRKICVTGNESEIIRFFNSKDKQ